jgi:NhaA family Na+:H+ antiporter
MVNLFGQADLYHAWQHTLHVFAEKVSLVLFFFLVGIEIRDETEEEKVQPDGTKTGGSLRGKKAVLPISSAAGGMLVPGALGVFFALAFGIEVDFLKFAAVAVATDIAFSMLGLKLARVRQQVLMFVAAAAVADDLGGIFVLIGIAEHHVNWLILAVGLIATIGLGRLLKALNRQDPYEYIPLFIIAWLTFHFAHFEQALCWLILPWLIPDKPLKWFEGVLEVPTELAMGVFGFAVAGVPIAAMGTATWAVLASFLIGKPIGFLAGIRFGEWITGERLTFGRTEKILAAMAMSIGFTVAMIIANVAFEPSPLRDEVIVGALLSGVMIAVVAIGGLLFLPREQRSKTAPKEEIEAHP